ncbi:HWE histidine kinase domain-containing protein [Henriciella marina]|uniref:HWE histidine kinase domain-containing protein n=1 Tax=Henriciella marina TaxID=453851 RepID=UPI0003656B32|nr:HWE histidine kinase domain-containing protein [Henriciella marina]
MTTPTVSPDTKIDLTNCDREPIHILGHVQQFGCLIAVNADWLVQHVSLNVREFLSLDPESIVGSALSDLITADALRAIRGRVQQLDGADAVERLFGIELMAGSDTRHNIAVHLSGQSVIIEIEPQRAEMTNDYTSYVRPMIDRVRKAKSVPELCKIAARQMKALTGFDRVMVYRFGEDQSGEVIAEAVSPNVDSFLGLHYPATDIPQQARELYRRNLLRIISNVKETVSPIIPERGPEGRPLDLSMSGLRAVSPIHIEYLKNMGVDASLSVSILHRDELWGLFACHHYEPRVLPYEIRSAAELFAQLFSFVLGQLIADEASQHHRRVQVLHDRLMAQLAGGRSVQDHFPAIAEALSSVIPNDGVAAWVDGEYVATGKTPTREDFMGIVRFLNTTAGSRVYATSQLGEVHPPARDYVDRAAGLLAVPVSRRPRDYVVLFREEFAQKVNWAGNPEKPVTYGPNGARLTPRKSFESWQQTVTGNSVPWRSAEISAAEQLRVTLLEVVLRMSDEAHQDRERANERQELLIAELNHRVRNILNLIRGLVSQSAREATSIVELSNIIGGRVQALARAHDQLTEDNWAPASLHRLIRTETEAYLGLKAARVKLEGPDVLLMPNAFSTLSLVLHELTTNSAKYGALADSEGQITIGTEATSDNELSLSWRESGGPAVQAPTRQGFGTTIITKSIPHELGGAADLRYALTGLEADFVIPAGHVSSFTKAAKGAMASEPASVQEPPCAPVLEGSALLVEDNMIIALDAEDLLKAAGARTVSLCGSVKEARQALSSTDFQFALLDVNLGSETSEPIAAELRDRGVPFVFATGYGDSSALSSKFLNVPILKKPYDENGLNDAIKAALA